MREISLYNLFIRNHLDSLSIFSYNSPLFKQSDETTFVAGFSISERILRFLSHSLLILNFYYKF
jgi:hypothetical protein